MGGAEAVTFRPVVWSRGRLRTAPRRPPGEERCRFDPLDAADIDARLAAVDVSRRDACLARRLRVLVDRQVPPRGVGAAPGVGAVRIRFADGTTVLGHGRSPGDVASLAVAMRRRSTPPAACTLEADGTHLLFHPRADRTVAVVVVGLDQPD